ncbi:hypothetical protein TrLO_g5075 [Triparma laevis f. longispina]|uniref:Uncharacterized protein n=1 Tax=Triparma laevis f. longispina TaxID=1714387 RepID=A0A9W6ZCX0_9STRA|nr:hypothetical protein TrLO_g5075 [Triparma laevis f. longispina]
MVSCCETVKSSLDMYGLSTAPLCPIFAFCRTEDMGRSWQFGISYVNNFVKANEDLVCGTDGQIETIFAYTSGFDKDATALTVTSWFMEEGEDDAFDDGEDGTSDGEDGTDGGDRRLSDESGGFTGIPTPFYILATSVWGQEVLKVTATNGKAPTVTRTSDKAISHTAAAGSTQEKLLTYFSEDPASMKTSTSLLRTHQGIFNDATCDDAGKLLPGVAISWDCEFLTMPGEESIEGYVGTMDHFNTMSGYSAHGTDSCGSCPGDTLYKNTAQAIDKGEFVCNFAAHGTSMKSADNWDVQETNVAFDVFSTGTPFPEVNIVLDHDKKKTSQTGTGYTVSVGTGLGNSETLNVLSVSAPVDGVQTMKVSAKKKDVYSKPKNLHIGAGYLMGAMTPLNDKIYVKPVDGYPFDKKGPYTIEINGESVLIASATKVTDRIPYQTLKPVVEEALLDGQLAFGIIRDGIDVEDIIITDVIPSEWTCELSWFNDGEFCDCGCGIYDPDCGDPSVQHDNFYCEEPGGEGNYCTYPESLCTNDIPESATPTAEDTIDKFVETIVTQTPLKYTWHAGAIFESATYYDEEEEEVMSDIMVGAVFDVTMHRSGKPQFDPIDRSEWHMGEQTTSPENLEVDDVSVYIVSERDDFDTVDLCPKVSTAVTPSKMFTQNGWDKWAVAPGKEMIPSCGAITTFDESVCLNVDQYKNQFFGKYRKACTDKMPPTKTYEYNISRPINNIWKSLESDAASGNKPEWIVEIEHKYVFSHDSMDDDVENSMAERGRSTGDIDQNQNAFICTGAKNYRGLGKTGSPSKENGIPATNPYIDPTVIIQPSAWAAKEITEYNPRYWPWELKLAQERVDKFKPVTIDFSSVEDLGGSNGQLLLEPGMQYTLSATVGFYPIFKQTITKTKLDYFSRQDAKVIYSITISDVDVQRIIKHNSSVSILMGQFGAAMAYMGIGLVLLKTWQTVTKQKGKMHEWAAKNNTADARLRAASTGLGGLANQLDGDEDEEEEETPTRQAPSRGS